MRYGYFDDENREYVITRPDTPLPWINYLGCEEYFGIISNTAGGYSFYRDARLRRLTRYRYNNAPFDLGGRYLYLRDNESGKFWSPSWQPTRTRRSSRLRLPARDGLHDHRLDATRGIEAEHPLLRPARREPGDLAARRHQPPRRSRRSSRCSRASSSASGTRRTTPPTSSATSAPARSRWKTASSTTRPSTASAAITSPTSPARPGWPASTRSATRSSAPYRGWENPAAVERGRSFNSIAHGWAPHRLAPRQADPRSPARSREVIFLLGYHENPGDQKFDPPGSQTINKRTVKPIIAKYLDAANVGAAFEALRTYWDGLLGMLPGAHARRAHQSHGQHLERLPVHDHLQHVALGVVLRVGHRARAGVPRLEPGPARLRAHGPRTRARNASWTSRPRNCRAAAPTTSTNR